MMKTMRPIAATCALAASFVLGTAPAHAVFEISTGATKNVSCGGGTCTSTASSAVLNAATLMNMLATTNVTLVSESTAKDIYFNAPISWSSTRSLTLTANRSIRFNQTLTDNGVNRLVFALNGGISSSLSFATAARARLVDDRALFTMNSQQYASVKSLAALAAAIASNPAARVVLADSFDAGPDGTYGAAPVPTNFQGIFEGLNNTISNLHVADTSASHNVGLFSSVGNNALTSVIENLVLAHVDIRGGSSSNVGGIAGRVSLPAATVKISGIRLSGHVTAGNLSIVGGVAGFAGNSSAIANVVSGAAITGGDDTIAGGIVGQGVDVAIDNVAASGAVRTGNASQTGAAAGGVLGSANNGRIHFASATGAVMAGDARGSKATGAGGLVGSLGNGEMTFSFATGPVTGGFGSSAGGLAAGLGAVTGQSYASGDVTAGLKGHAGGFASSCGNQFTDTFALGSVTGGEDSTVGGYAAMMVCTMTTSYSAGLVSAPKGSIVGGSVGNAAGQFNSAYWDKTASGTKHGVGECHTDCDPIGLSHKQLKSALPAGFDPSIWGLSAEVNRGLPYLLALPPK